MKVLGIMSGSSLDGVDLALCRFEQNDDLWKYEILAAECLDYTNEWRERLKTLPEKSAKVFCQTHFDYGHLLGKYVNQFLLKYQQKADLIASHGHTVFHSPETKMTVQIGEGSALAMATKTKVITELRTADVANGGQGAPIVPLVDKCLFPEYKACLNLGGIANISIRRSKDKVLAFDICPLNQALNFLANKLGLKYDDKGNIAQKGNVLVDLLASLNELDFYKRSIPKSMANVWIREKVLPLIECHEGSTSDKLRTVVEHIAIQMQIALKEFKIEGAILTTGGGAYNDFLIAEIEKQTNLKLFIPAPEVIEYKEAIAMAFLGFLRNAGIENVLSSVTGASKNTINGALYLP